MKNKYNIDDKIIYAKLAQAGRKDGISMNQLSKKFGVSDVTLGKWLKAYEAGHLMPEIEKQENANSICGKIEVTNARLKQCLLRIDAFYQLIETKADEFIEALTFLASKLEQSAPVFTIKNKSDGEITISEDENETIKQPGDDSIVDADFDEKTPGAEDDEETFETEILNEIEKQNGGS